MLILGISAYYHDSAAVLLSGETLVAAAQQERFSRRKHDAAFPSDAVRYVLDAAGAALSDLECIVFYDKPLLKFERLLETYYAFSPWGLRSYLAAMPIWIKEKLFLRKQIWTALERMHGGRLNPRPRLLFPEHHLSHAASAFYPSPFEQAAILTIDGVGEWATTTIGRGSGSTIELIKEHRFPHSLGLLYSAFTAWCGFKVNGGEYKLMGLAPYGDPQGDRTRRYSKAIRENLIDLRPDGSFLLNMGYFDFATGLSMCNRRRWRKLFDLPQRRPESELHQGYMDLALAIQQVTEMVILRLAATAHHLTGLDNLVMAGGVALNCVANGKLLRQSPFKRLWVQPAAGDAGGALGAAYAALHIFAGNPRSAPDDGGDRMQGAYLGPEFAESDVREMVRRYGAICEPIAPVGGLCSRVAKLLADGCVVGWFQGRMEWGPRALGNRSILGDPRHPRMQRRINRKIKNRESFRPFAPSVLLDACDRLFQLEVPSPYMLLVAPVREAIRRKLPRDFQRRDWSERLEVVRSELPAVTHVDFSARIHTVDPAVNPRFWRLIDAFKRLTGYGCVVNTSFNVRGEPIVCTPRDAYRCFMTTDMDYLVIGDLLFDKQQQPAWKQV